MSLIEYEREWEQFTKENPDQIINIMFEDLKEVNFTVIFCHFVLCSNARQQIGQVNFTLEIYQIIDKTESTHQYCV